jgi:epoxide hydrolase-like predicted phosphatase
MRTRAVLFDLGNVVLHIDWEPVFAHWAARSVHPKDEVRRRFRIDEPYRLHETGHLDAAGYFAHLRKTLGLQCDDDQIRAGWNANLGPEIADTIAVIDALRERGVPCHALSNTNALHLEAIERAYPALLPRFERVFVSHEIGLRKPSPESFRHVLDTLDLDPGEVLFFDDLQPNVDGARALGIDAVLVRGPQDVRAAVAARGLL